MPVTKRKPELELLYADDSVTVEFGAGVRNTLVVSFNSFAGEESALMRFGYPFLLLRGFPVVYVTARKNHWWQVESMTEAAAKVREITARYRRAVGYGSSMGGFGALLFAQDMGLTHVVAASPQTVLGDAFVQARPEWQEFIKQRPIIRNHVRKSLRYAKHAVVLFDPHQHRDSEYVRYISGVRSVVPYPTPYASHNLLRSLHEAGVVSDIVTKLLLGKMDYPSYRAAFREARRRSPIYLDTLSRRCERKGHLRWAKSLRPPEAEKAATNAGAGT